MSLTKSSLLQRLSEDTNLDKKSCGLVLEVLAEIIKDELASTGEVTIPGVVKLKAKATPATKTRVGINPFTKQEQTFHSKPAGFKVRALPVKNVKDVFR